MVDSRSLGSHLPGDPQQNGHVQFECLGPTWPPSSELLGKEEERKGVRGWEGLEAEHSKGRCCVTPGKWLSLSGQPCQSV